MSAGRVVAFGSASADNHGAPPGCRFAINRQVSMTSLRQLLPLSLLPFLLTGCDKLYGIRREATLRGPLQIACISEAARTVSAVSGVRMTTPDTLQYQLRGTFGRDKSVQLWPSIVVREKNSGVKVFIHSFEEKDYAPQLGDVRVTHAAMLSVEDAIFRNCVYAPSLGQITEKCTGVQC